MPASHTSPDGSALVVIGLGDVAGGAETLQTFFADLPITDGAAFAVVLQLSAEDDSHLAEILGGGLPLPVAKVSGRTEIEAGHVYVVPPGQNLLINGGHLALESAEVDRTERRPTDALSRTLAAIHGPQAVAVVLSGAGQDGRDAQRVRERGGEVQTEDLGEKRETRPEELRVPTDLVNVIASTEVASLFLDRELRVRWFTPHIRDLFRLLPSDIGRPLADLAEPVGGAPLVADAEAAVERLAAREREVEAPGGRWFLVHTGPYLDGDDQIAGVVLTFVDVSRRRADEQILRQSEQRLRRMVESVPGVLFETDREGRLRFVSREVSTLTGRHPADWEGEALDPEMIHADDRERVIETWAHALREGTAYELRHRLLTPDGVRWVISRARPVRDAEGRIEGWFGSIADVDALSRSGDEVRRLNDALEKRVAERTAEVRRLLSRLASAADEERQLIARVLHDDLQQHFVALKITLGLLRKASEAERALLSAQADEILTLATDLTRTLSRELRPRMLDSPDLAASLQWLAQRSQKHLHLDIHLEADVVPVPEHDARALLFHSVRELILNVVKHSGTFHATIRAYRDGPEAVVEVEDEGNGFDPREARTGTGLGLPGILQRVEGMGGRADVASVPGEGARITLRLPAGDDEDRPAGHSV